MAALCGNCESCQVCHISYPEVPGMHTRAVACGPHEKQGPHSNPGSWYPAGLCEHSSSSQALNPPSAFILEVSPAPFLQPKPLSQDCLSKSDPNTSLKVLNHIAYRYYIYSCLELMSLVLLDISFNVRYSEKILLLMESQTQHRFKS